MDEETRLLSAALQDDDVRLEPALRPRSLAEYVGQEKVVQNLEVFIRAARARDESLDHVLLCGPPGLGKTTLAHIIAREMGAAIRVTSGPVLEKAGDLAAILTQLEPREILFIDEIHRLGSTVEEILYPAVEDFRLDLVVGQGPAARTMEIPLPPFTLIGATTRAGLITKPLHARFGIVQRLDFYSADAIQQILRRSARLLEVEADDDGTAELARRSRGTPRIANRLLRRVRDFAQVEADGRIDHTTARRALAFLEVDEHGFDDVDRRILAVLIEHYGGGPAGIQAIAAAIGEDSDTLEDVHEPFLIQAGFLQRTSRGRVATARAFQHLGFKAPARSGSLF